MRNRQEPLLPRIPIPLLISRLKGIPARRIRISRKRRMRVQPPWRPSDVFSGAGRMCHIPKKKTFIIITILIKAARKTARSLRGQRPSVKKRRSPRQRRKKTMMETLKTRKRKAGAGAPEDPQSAAGSVSPLSPSSFPELPPGTPRDREAGTAGPGFPPRRPRLSSSADRPAPCALCLRRKMAAEGRCLLLEQLTGTRPRRRRRFFLPRLKAAQRRQRPLPVPQPRSVRP